MNIEFEKYQRATTIETLDIDIEFLAKSFIEDQLDSVYSWIVDNAEYDNRNIPNFTEDEYPDPDECFENISDKVVKYIRDNWLK